MENTKNYSDERLFYYCIYCRNGSNESNPMTIEHIPPKSLLDKPYPENLQTLHVCKDCNNKFSYDEQYLSCIIECARCGSYNPDDLLREKVKKTLRSKIKIFKRLSSCFTQTTDGQKCAHIEKSRVRDTILKISRGHAAYYMSETSLPDPVKIMIKPIVQMANNELKLFDNPIKNIVFPEVGSPLSFSFLIDEYNNIYSDWINVQEGQYRFMVGINNGIIVKIIISEYLACEVIWNDEYVTDDSECIEDIPDYWIKQLRNNSI